MTATTGARARDIRYVSIEPGRISLHGVSLTDGEYAVLRGIAERMKRPEATRTERRLVGYGECRCILSQYCDGTCRPLFEDVEVALQCSSDPDDGWPPC